MRHHHQIKKSVLVAKESPELKQEIEYEIQVAKASDAPKPSMDELLSTSSSEEEETEDED